MEATLNIIAPGTQYPHQNNQLERKAAACIKMLAGYWQAGRSAPASAWPAGDPATASRLRPGPS